MIYFVFVCLNFSPLSLEAQPLLDNFCLLKTMFTRTCSSDALTVEKKNASTAHASPNKLTYLLVRTN